MKKLMLSAIMLLSFVGNNINPISFGKILWYLFPAKLTIGAGAGYAAGRILPGFYKSEEFKNQEYNEYVNGAHADQLFSDKDKEALFNKENKTSLYNTFAADMLIFYSYIKANTRVIIENLIEKSGLSETEIYKNCQKKYFRQQESKNNNKEDNK